MVDASYVIHVLAGAVPRSLAVNTGSALLVLDQQLGALDSARAFLVDRLLRIDRVPLFLLAHHRICTSARLRARTLGDFASGPRAGALPRN